MPQRTIEINEEKLADINNQLASGATTIDIGGGRRLNATSPILTRMRSTAPGRGPTTVAFLRKDQTPDTDIPTPTLPPTQGTQPPGQGTPINVNVAPGTLPSQFDLTLQQVLASQLGVATAPYKKGLVDTGQQIVDLQGQMGAIEGWGGLNLEQARRIQSMNERGLGSLMQGWSTAMDYKQSRLKDLQDTAVKAFEETLAQQAKEDEAKLKAEDVAYHKELDILNMRLDYPAGESFTIEGKTYTGLKEKAESTTGKTVSWDEKTGTSKTGPFENKVTGQGVITGYGSSAWSHGLDISGELNSKLLSPYDGTIVEISNEFKSVGPNNEEGLSQNEGFGNQVKIKMNDGNIVWISHLNAVNPNLEVGQQITTGESVGMMGNTGYTMGATGVHTDLTVEKPDGSYMTPKQVEQYIAGMPGQGTESYQASQYPSTSYLSDILKKVSSGSGAKGVVDSIINNTTILKTLANGLSDVESDEEKIAVIKQSVLDSRNVEINDAQAQKIINATQVYLAKK